MLESPEETIALGEKLGLMLSGGTVIALRGGLGAGKTTFTKGVALGLGIDDVVTSPTYTIVSEYEGRLRLHHVDAYRLTGPEDFESVGGEDLLSDSGGVCLIEWSERIVEALPSSASSIELQVLESGIRRLTMSGNSIEALFA